MAHHGIKALHHPPPLTSSFPPPPPLSLSSFSVLDQGEDGGAEEEARMFCTRGLHENLSDDSIFGTSHNSPAEQIVIPERLSGSSSFRSLVSSLASESIVWRGERLGLEQEAQLRKKTGMDRPVTEPVLTEEDDDCSGNCEPIDEGIRVCDTSCTRWVSEDKSSLDCRMEATSLSLKSNSPYSNPFHAYQSGVSSLLSGNLDHARSCFLSSLNMHEAALGASRRGSSESSDSRLCVGDVYQVLATVANLKSDVKEAVEYSYLALRSLRSQSQESKLSSGLKAKIANINLQLGDVFFECGQFYQALGHFKNFLSYASNTKNEGSSGQLAISTAEKMGRIHEVLAECANEEKRHQMALFHHRESLGLRYLLEKKYRLIRDTCWTANYVGRSCAGRGYVHMMRRLRHLQKEHNQRLAADSKVSCLSSQHEGEFMRALSGVKGENSIFSPFLEAIKLLQDVQNNLHTALEKCDERLKILQNQPSGSSRLHSYSKKGRKHSHETAAEEQDIASTYLQMGFLHSRAGHQELAAYHFRRGFRILRRVVNAAPTKDKVSDLRRTIALSYLAIGREEMALQWLRQCLGTSLPRSPGRDAGVLFAMGIVYGRTGRTADAIKCFIRAVHQYSYATAAKVETKVGDEERGNADGEGESASLTELLLPNLQGLLKSQLHLKKQEDQTKLQWAGGTDNICESVLDARDIEVVLEFWGLALLRRAGSMRPSSSCHHVAICRFEMLVVFHRPGKPAGDSELLFLYSMGNILFRRGRWAEAIEFYQSCLANMHREEIGNSSVDIFLLHSNLGNACQNAGMRENSAQYCKTAVLHIQEAYDTVSVDDAKSSTTSEVDSLIRDVRNFGTGYPVEGECIPKLSCEGDIKLSHTRCFALCKEGRYDEAAALLFAIKEELVRIRGKENSDSIRLSYDLCFVFLLQGDVESSRKVYDEIKKSECSISNSADFVGENLLKQIIKGAF